MPKGIFNPYQKPKKNFVSPTGAKPFNTEFQEASGGTIRLDGDSYILELAGADLKEVPSRLGALIYDVTQLEGCKDELARYGIRLHLPQEKLDLSPEELIDTVILKTDAGFLQVHIEDFSSEVGIYRRIAHALYCLPIRNILKKHRARIIVRG